MAGYLYGNSFDVRIKLNTYPNLTPNPIRTHDRAPNPNRPMSQKKTLRPVGVVKHGKITNYTAKYCSDCSGRCSSPQKTAPTVTPLEQSQDCCNCRLRKQLSKDCHKDGMVGTAFLSNSCYNVYFLLN